MPPPSQSRVAAEGAVGDRQRAAVEDAAARQPAELPLMVLSVTVSRAVVVDAAAGVVPSCR